MDVGEREGEFTEGRELPSEGWGRVNRGVSVWAGRAAPKVREETAAAGKRCWRRKGGPRTVWGAW